MGIESLNSAVAAAGFAMVSDEDVDIIAGQSSFPQTLESPMPSGMKTQAHALIDTTARAPAVAVQSLGEKVTGLLGSWRPKA